MSDAQTSHDRSLIFISYRRDDATGASGRLYDWLRIAFGRDHVFRDAHDITVGRWRDIIDTALARSAVCVAVIGRRWTHPDNLRRLLHDPEDMVVHELRSALAIDGLSLIPVLVEGAEVPQSADLPPALTPLRQWNFSPITEVGWEDDTRRVIARIATAAGLVPQPDYDTLLRAAAAAQRRILDDEGARKLQADQIDALRNTVDDLTRKLAEAGISDRTEVADAFAALARGEWRAAEEAFEREFEVQARVAAIAQRRKAVAARNVANVALLHDVRKAVAFYRKALLADPTLYETSWMLGRAQMLVGDLSEAHKAFADTLRAAEAANDLWGQMVALIGMGDVRRDIGNLNDAHAAYSAAAALADALAQDDPSNTRWQRARSATHDGLGEVLLKHGDGPGAMAAFRLALSILEALAARDTANSEWQRDLSVIHTKIGSLLLTQASNDGALAAFRAARTIRIALAAHDPHNAERRADLSAIHTRIGDALKQRGDVAGAVESFRSAHSLAKAVAAGDPANTEWQRMLFLSQLRIGELLAAQGDHAGALTAFRDGLVISQALVTRDTTNMQWLRDLAVSHNRIGDVLIAQHDVEGALAAFQRALGITHELAARDGANTEWQRDLSVGYLRVGEVLAKQERGAEASAALNNALQIAERLAESDPTNTQWQRDVQVSHYNIGEMLLAQHKGAGALAHFQTALAIAAALAERDSANIQSQRELAFNHKRLGDALVLQGDGEGALAAFNAALEIMQALQQRDLNNPEWQREVIVNLLKIQKVTGDSREAHRALELAEQMQQRGTWLPRDAWLIEELKARFADKSIDKP